MLGSAALYNFLLSLWYAVCLLISTVDLKSGFIVAFYIWTVPTSFRGTFSWEMCARRSFWQAVEAACRPGNYTQDSSPITLVINSEISGPDSFRTSLWHARRIEWRKVARLWSSELVSLVGFSAFLLPAPSSSNYASPYSGGYLPRLFRSKNAAFNHHRPVSILTLMWGHRHHLMHSKGSQLPRHLWSRVRGGTDICKPPCMPVEQTGNYAPFSDMFAAQQNSNVVRQKFSRCSAV